MAPTQKLLSRWAGIEPTVNLFADYPEDYEKMAFAIEHSQGELVEILAASPAEVVILPENLSSDVTGEYLFKRFNMPYYTKIVNRLHAAGKKVAIHIDGRLKPCLGLLSQCGFDIAEAVTPVPFGDLAVEELRKYAGNDIVIWGGLPGGIFSSNFSDRYFEDYVLNVINNVDDKFVIGVADQVPPDAVPWRIRRVRELVESLPRRIKEEKSLDNI
jgi:uroporphyrinogen-III decarboxylase